MPVDSFESFTHLFSARADRRTIVKVLTTGAVGSIIAGFLNCGGERPTAPPDEEPDPVEPQPPGEAACIDSNADRVTGASLRAARQRLAEGADDVSLSPGGCVRLKRTRMAGQVTSDVMTIEGQQVLRWQFDGTAATGHQDADLDGFAEWTSEYTGVTATTYRHVLTQFDPSTRMIRHRRTTQRTNDTLHVKVEEDDGVMLGVVDEYETSQLQTTLTTQGAGACGQGCQGQCPDPQNPPKCTPDQCNQLRNKVDDAAAAIAYCKSDLLGSAYQAIDWEIMYVLAGWTLDISCGKPTRTDGATVIAQTTTIPWYIPALVRPTLVVNEDIFCGFNSTCQQAFLIHELLHAENGHAHNPKKESSCTRDQVDEIYACAHLCTNPAGNSTVCQCHVCGGYRRDRCAIQCMGSKFKAPTDISTQGTAASNCCHKDAKTGSIVLGYVCTRTKEWFDTSQGCTAACGSSPCDRDELKCNRY